MSIVSYISHHKYQQVNKIARFWIELKRRNVVRRNAVYAATAFVILELVSIIAEPLGLPDWTLLVVIILLSIGFIISIIFSWIYETNPVGGLEKTQAVQYNEGETHPAGSSTWKIASFISFFVIIALIILNVIPRNPLADNDQNLERSIAVLPFENMSNREEDGYFGDAMTDEIIMQLYKIEAFDVRSRTSVIQYKTTEKTIPTIGDELKVNYLIEGSAQRFNDQIRIRVQLIYAPSDTHLWGEVYEGSWTDILSVQSTIAQQVAGELKTVLSTREIEEIERPKTENLDAYEIYLKALFFQNKRNRDGFLKAIDYYEEAIGLDPKFAMAYSGLSYSYTLLGIYDLMPTHKVFPKAQETVLKALKLDPQLGEAHTSLAMLRIIEGDLPGAEEAYLRSIELSPDIPESHHGYSYLLAWMGKHYDAIEEAKVALDLEPLNPVMSRGLGYVYYFHRQFDMAIEEYRKSIEIDPDQLIAYQWLSWALHASELYEEAIDALGNYLILLEKEDAAEIIKNNYKESGYEAALLQLIEISKEESIVNITGPYWNSILYALIGEREEAFALLEIYVDQEYPWRLMNPAIYPFYDSISADPRSNELSQKSGFALK